MANIKSAKKRVLQNERNRLQNCARRSAIKTAMKKVVTAVEAGEKKEVVVSLFNDAQSKIARAQGKGLFHRNTAARKISRLAKKISGVFAAPKKATKAKKEEAAA